MEKLEENCKKFKDEISQSIDSFILELQSRKKCLFEQVDALVAVSAHPQLTSGDELSPEGVPRGTTGGLLTSDQSSVTDESSSTDSDSIIVSDKTDQSWETDESFSTDRDSIDVSDETEMKNLSDTIVMFPRRCLSKCKNVYQGEMLSHALSNRQCAIKFPQETDQSNKEVKILKKLGTHPHVVSLLQSGVVDGIFNERFLVLELCCKDDLDQYLTNTSCNSQLSLRYCIQIIEGMKYIHDKCIIHKDLKPANILLTLDLQRVKIADFGISHEIKSKRSMVFCEYRFGTVGYRPPESFGNAYISLKSDIFSLGALFHYIMSGLKSAFGPEPDLRDSNIIKGNVRIAHLLVPNPNTFSHLFELMMSKERRYRPTIWQIEDHPCWRLKEHDCDFDYGCVDEIDDSSDEGAHSLQIEVVDPFDEFAILKEMLEILEPEEERIHNNKGYLRARLSSAQMLTERMERKIEGPVEAGPRTSDTKVMSSAREQLRNQEPVEGVSRKRPRLEHQPTASQRYRNRGKVKKYFGTEGNGVGQLNLPTGICSTASDDLVVADSNNHRIQIFDVNGRVKGLLGGYGLVDGLFDRVADVCVTSRGRIVASDGGNHRIQIFDEQGRFVRKFGGKGSGDGELNSPGGVATDESGLIYVCDHLNHRVQVFSEEGKFVRKFGSVEKRFQKPSSISVTSNGRVIISDWDNHRVVVCDPHGRHLLQVGGPLTGTGKGQFQNPQGVAADDHGNIIVCDCNNHRVQVFTSGGEFVACFGSYGSDPGQMKTPSGVCVLSDGRIAVTEWVNHRVQIF